MIPNGTCQGVLTPMTAGGEVDYPMLEKLVDFHIVKANAASLCLLLNLAESPSLNLGERQRVIESAGIATTGRVPILVNVTTSDFEGQLALSSAAAAIGAAAVVAMPPYCRHLSHIQATQHFRDLGRSISLPMILYHSPHTGHGIDAKTPAALYREGLPILGVKDASFDAEYAARVSASMAEDDPSFAFMPGIEYLLPIASLGGRSTFGICGSIAPRLIGRLEQAVAGQDWVGAALLQDKVSALIQLLLGAYPASAKAAAAIMGRPVGRPRLPHTSLTSRSVERLERSLERLGILDEEPHGW